MKFSNEEEILINALRDCKISPVACLVGTRNNFQRDNDSGQWDNLIKIMDSYLDI